MGMLLAIQNSKFKIQDAKMMKEGSCSAGLRGMMAFSS
jgi:hypothetical protein